MWPGRQTDASCISARMPATVFISGASAFPTVRRNRSRVDPPPKRVSRSRPTDGRSSRQSDSVVAGSRFAMHPASGQITGEGYAFWPLFSADGTKLVYRISPRGSGGQTPVSGQSPSRAVGDGRDDRDRPNGCCPDNSPRMYDLSASGRIVATILEADGKSRVWLAWLDDREPPRRVADIDADNARFAAGDAIVFRAADGDAFPCFASTRTGPAEQRSPRSTSARRSATHRRTANGSARGETGKNRGMWLLSTNGMKEPVLFLASATGQGNGRLRWSPDGRQAYFSVATTRASAFGVGRTYVIPLRSGSLLPDIPTGGFRSDAEIARLPGVEVIPYGDVALGPTRGTYAFSRETVTRNLYRIPLP